MDEVSDNHNVVVVDAQESGANGGYKYDINEVLELIEAWQLDKDGPQTLLLPAMAAQHRSQVHRAATNCVGVRYESVETDEAGSMKVVQLTRTASFVPRAVKTRGKSGYEKLPLGASEVIPGFLFLGSGRDADDTGFLQRTAISHVLNVTSEWRENRAFEALKIAFRRIDVKDFVTSSLVEHFDPALAFIDEARAANGRILVHCVVGKSRSAAIVLAYMMTRHSLSLRAAFERVWAVRDFVRPNDSFFLNLVSLEAKLLPSLAPSINLGDLPPMKQPQAPNSNDVDEWVQERLPPEKLSALWHASRGNRNSFLKACVSSLLPDCKGVFSKKRVESSVKSLYQTWEEGQ